MIFDSRQLSRIEAQREESPDVARLIAQRDQFLKDHPHLMELQREIDSLLGTTLDPVKRLEILFMVMSDKLMELRSVFAEAVRIARTAIAEDRGSPEETSPDETGDLTDQRVSSPLTSSILLTRYCFPTSPLRNTGLF